MKKAMQKDLTSIAYPSYYKNKKDFVKLMSGQEVMKISFFKNNIYVSYINSEILVNTIINIFQPCREEDFLNVYRQALDLLAMHI